MLLLFSDMHFIIYALMYLFMRHIKEAILLKLYPYPDPLSLCD